MSKDNHSEAMQHFQNYANYNEKLRTWIVAYAIGAPVFFFSNSLLGPKVLELGQRNCIVFLFLSVSFLQVSLAFLNKWCAHNNYYSLVKESHSDTKLYKCLKYLNDHPQIDVGFDIASIISLVMATWILLTNLP